MENTLPIFYLSFLLGILTIAAFFVFRQIVKTRRIEKNLSQLRDKLKKGKGTTQEYYELGSIYLEKKLFTEASVLLQKALKAEDADQENLAPIHNALGYAYFAKEQYDLAIRSYKEALKINPDYVVALNNIGHAYERKQLTVQALEAYDNALKLEPSNQTAKRRGDSLRKRLVPSS